MNAPALAPPAGVLFDRNKIHTSRIPLKAALLPRMRRKGKGGWNTGLSLTPEGAVRAKEAHGWAKAK